MWFKRRLWTVAAMLTLLLCSVNLASAQLSLPGQPVTPGSANARNEQELAALKAAMDTASGGVIGLEPRVPPANDNLANAIPVAMPFQMTIADIEDATVENGKLAFCNGNNQDVWFTFTLETTKTIDIDLAGSNYDTVLSLHAGPPAATSASQLEFLICNDDLDAGFSYLTSGLMNQTLPAGTYYLQVSEYGGAPMMNGELIVSIKQTGDPQPFSYYYPRANMTYAIAPVYYQWSTSNLATSYDFTMYQTNAPRATVEVFSLLDLTPEGDTDPLECGPFVCLLKLDSSNASLITTMGDYLWVVKAKNSATSIDASNIDTDNNFSTNFAANPGSFYLYDLKSVFISAPLFYSWQEPLDATSYDLIVNKISPVAEPGVLQLNNLTPAVDDDGLNCFLGGCYLNLEPALRDVQLDDNATYEWTVNAKNANGQTPANQPDTFEVDSTPLPGNFYPLPNLLYNDPANNLSTITLSASEYAETYDIVIKQTAPVMADILNLTGLTPDYDDDAFTCMSVDTCTLSIPDAATLFTSGSYTMDATAINANGSTMALQSSFIVNTGLGFVLQTPADGSVFASGEEITSFTWSVMSEASAVSEYYVLGIWTSFPPYGDVNISFLTPAADTDALTCTVDTCTLAATGKQLGFKRNIFYLNIIAVGSYTEGDYTLYNSGGASVVTVGAVPVNFTIQNGDFEDFNSDTKLPDDWDAKGILTGSKVKCNKENKTFAVSGSCAWIAKGKVTKGSLGQTLDGTNLLPGDTVWLDGWLAGKHVTKARVLLKIKYASDPTGKLKLNAATGKSEYTYYSTSVQVTSVPTKIKLKVANQSNSGKLQVDALNAWVAMGNNTTLAAPGALPLPAAVDSELSSSRSIPESSLGSSK